MKYSSNRKFEIAVRKTRRPRPTTGNPIYTDEEREFMVALDKYKRDNRRPFPTCSDVLGVLKSLGYSKNQN